MKLKWKAVVKRLYKMCKLCDSLKLQRSFVSVSWNTLKGCDLEKSNNLKISLEIGWQLNALFIILCNNVFYLWTQFQYHKNKYHCQVFQSFVLFWLWFSRWSFWRESTKAAAMLNPTAVFKNFFDWRNIRVILLILNIPAIIYFDLFR